MRTIFNFLGPLTNPAGANRQLLGVADRHYQETIAEALVGLGSVRALVVAAEDGLDELSISSRTRVIEVADGGTAEWFVEPGQFGLAPAELEDGGGGTPAENAAAVRGGAGRRARAAPRPRPCSTPPPRSTSAASPPTSSEGVAKAAEAIDSGRGRKRAGAPDRGDGRRGRLGSAGKWE